MADKNAVMEGGDRSDISVVLDHVSIDGLDRWNSNVYGSVT